MAEEAVAYNSMGILQIITTVFYEPFVVYFV
jgi:hypothetical protein